MSGGFRPHRMDPAKIWSRNCALLKPSDVRLHKHVGRTKGLLNRYLRLITIFLYMVAELSALQQIVNALTGLYGLPAVIVECAVTTAYTWEFHFFCLTDLSNT